MSAKVSFFFFLFPDQEFAALRLIQFPNTVGHVERVRGRFLISPRENLGQKRWKPGCKVTKQAQMC